MGVHDLQMLQATLVRIKHYFPLGFVFMNRVKKKKVMFCLKKIHFRIDKHKKDFILFKLINQPLKI